MLDRTAHPLRGFGNWLADLVRAFYRVLGTPGRYLQDFFNGVWLGHSLHAVLVDVVVGGATAALLLDVLRVAFGVEGLETGTTWVVGLVWLAGVGSVVSGLTDFKDTSPNSATRDVTVFHGLINIVGLVLFVVSLQQRAGGNHDAGFWLFLIGYLVISVGAYIGGHIVYKYGYSVNFNAFSKGRRAKEFTAVMAADALPEATPTKAMLGSTAVVLVRRGELVHALKETCSHLGGPLSEGTLRDDTIECPWHQSVFHLADGSVKHGPATNRQIRYRARIQGGQVELQGPEA